MSAIAKIRSALDRFQLFSLKDMIWQYVASFGVAIFGAMYILGAGRILGPQDFGIYAIAAATPTVMNALFDYRIQEVSIVILSEKADRGVAARNVRSLFLFDILARLVAFVLSVPAGILILNLLGLDVDPMVPLFAALGLFFAKVGNGIAIGIMRLSGNIHKYAMLQSLDWALRLAGLAAVYFFGALTIESAFLVQLPSALFVNLWILFLAYRIGRRTYDLDGGGHATIRDLRDFCRVRLKILLSSQSISAVDSVVKELDTLICGIFLSPHAVAIYKMAKSIASIAWKCVDPIFVVILPNIASYISEGKIDELSAILKKATGYLFLIALFVFLCVWALSYPFTRFFLGASYEDVPTIIPLISIWIVVALPFIWTHSVAIASGNAALQALSGLIGAIIGVGALVVGAASFGLPGAAIGLSVAYAGIFVISSVLLVKKKIVQW
jgi:O-antigen/teichoic acid export membrane protein